MKNIDRIRKMDPIELAGFLCVEGWHIGEEPDCVEWLEQEETELKPDN